MTYKIEHSISVGNCGLCGETKKHEEHSFIRIQLVEYLFPIGSRWEYFGCLFSFLYWRGLTACFVACRWTLKSLSKSMNGLSGSGVRRRSKLDTSFTQHAVVMCQECFKDVCSFYCTWWVFKLGDSLEFLSFYTILEVVLIGALRCASSQYEMGEAD